MMSLGTVTLLGLKISVYTRIVRLLLEEKKINYTLTEVDIFEQGGPPEHYLARNPFGTIPCLLHNDFCLYETVAISKYLDALDSATTFQPDDLKKRARMDQIISVLDSYGYRPMVWDVFVERVVVPEEGGDPDEGKIKNALGTIDLVLKELSTWMGESEFLCGDAISLADFHAFPMICYFSKTPEGEEMLGSHHKLHEWLQRIQTRPSVINTAGKYN